MVPIFACGVTRKSIGTANSVAYSKVAEDTALNS